MPEGGPGGETAVRVEREGCRRDGSGVGEIRLGRDAVPEDSDYARQCGVAGDVGRVEAHGEGPGTYL